MLRIVLEFVMVYLIVMSVVLVMMIALMTVCRIVPVLGVEIQL